MCWPPPGGGRGIKFTLVSESANRFFQFYCYRKKNFPQVNTLSDLENFSQLFQKNLFFKVCNLITLERIIRFRSDLQSLIEPQTHYRRSVKVTLSGNPVTKNTFTKNRKFYFGIGKIVCLLGPPRGWGPTHKFHSSI